MKRIASFLALILFSAMSFAGSIGAPTNIDFGSYSIKGLSEVTDSVELTLSPSGISENGIVVEVVDDAEGIFWVSNTWLYPNGTPDFHGVNKAKVYFYAIEKGTYTAKLRLTDYDTEAYEDVQLKVVITDEAIVPKTIPFERVETTSGLNHGDTIVFVCESVQEACGPLDGAALSTIGITLNAGKADIPEDGIQMFRATKYSGNWQFHTVETTPKRLHLDIESNNAKGAFTYADTKAGAILANWGVAITNGDAVVSRPDEDQTYPVRWVSGSTGGRFKPYLNVTGSDISIYKKVGSAVDIQSKLEVSAIDFGSVELGEEKEVVVNYTGENLTADIMWDITGADAALFSVTPTTSTNRTSGSVTVKYLGTAAAVKTINAKLYALTQDAKLDDLEKEVSISITLVPNTIKLTKIEFVDAPDSLVKGTSIDLKPYLVFTPDNAADKSLTWTVDKSYQGTVEDGVYTAKNVTGSVTITATSVKVPSVSASVTLMQYEPKPASITLDKHEITTYIGETVTLQGIVGPEGASQKCWYTSRNTSIITCKKGNVDGAGVLTVKALCPEGVWVIVNPGSSATDYPNIKDSCLVKVVPVTVESVAFDPDSKEMTVGAQAQLTPVVTPAAATTQYTATYESNNTSVATISETGLVTAKAEGTAEITCTLGGKSGKITINVVGAKFFTKVTDASTLKANDTIILATKITLSEVLTPIVGGEPNSSGNLEIIQSGVTITDDNAACETALTLVVGGAENAYTLTKLGSTSKLIAKDDKKVGYGSSNTTWKFDTDGNGIIVRNTTQLTKCISYSSQSGMVRQYATGANVTPLYVYVRSYAEPVKPAATGVSLDQTALDFYVGDADVTLKAIVTPNDADQTVIWESSNTDVATVNANGKVHAVAKGNATITAKVKSNESLKAECAVTVNEWEVTEVKFAEGLENTVEVGKTITVTATAYPTGHGFKVTYSSSNTEIATVSMDGGVVKGIAAGNVIITAKSGVKSAEMTIHVVAAPVPEEKGDISVADFLAAKDEFNIYTLTGVVANITNTKYGNFDLVDETGKIYIYGLLNAAGEAQKFAELNVAEKDTVTLKGSYSEHNNKAQIKNALFVSVKKYVEPVGPSTAIDAVMKQGHATKVLREGQVIIIREEKEFDVIGRRVK